jgi:hypothetical protein
MMMIPLTVRASAEQLLKPETEAVREQDAMPDDDGPRLHHGDLELLTRELSSRCLPTAASEADPPASALQVSQSNRWMLTGEGFAARTIFCIG